METLTRLIKEKPYLILLVILATLLCGMSFRKILDKDTRIRKKKIEYLVVHYTANAHEGADAEANAKYLQHKEAAGAHYVIDDVEIIQTVPENQVAYAVGGRKWLGFIPKPWLDNKIKNENSLSFEMCLGGGRNDSLIVDKTAQAIAWQMLNKGFFRYDTVTVAGNKQYMKVPDLGRIVRHHDVTGKPCPRFYYMDDQWNQQKEDRAFWKFKNIVSKYFKSYVEFTTKRTATDNFGEPIQGVPIQ